jgi:hypothetical protein
LKKRSKELLLPRGFHLAGQIPYRATGGSSKSFLGLFFRKNLCLPRLRLYKIYSFTTNIVKPVTP